MPNPDGSLTQDERAAKARQRMATEAPDKTAHSIWNMNQGSAFFSDALRTPKTHNANLPDTQSKPSK